MINTQLSLSMRLALTLALAVPCFAAKAAAPEAAPDQEAADRLHDAQVFYGEGVRLLKVGDIEAGRAELKRAFDIVLTHVEEDSLPASFQPEFAAILEKIKTWEAPAEEGEEASALDVSEEALESASPAVAAPVRDRAVLPIDPNNTLTQKFVQVYTKQRPRSVEDALARSGRYRELIEREIKAQGLPPELFWLVMTESEYKPNAVSRAGAAGLWQFMPFTARKYGLEVNYWIDERYLPEKATPAALRYLSDLYQWFGDWHLALAAYNRGENGIGRDLKFSRSQNFGGLSDRSALPKETHHYVPKFMACALIGREPEKYGLKPDYEKPPEYESVPLPRSLDLAVAAKCAGVAEDVIKGLNPHIRTWATPKDRPGFALRIPKGTKERFDLELAKVEDWTPGPTMVRYKVRRGDFLGRIAKKHNTSIRSIMEINKLKNPRLLRPGMTLLIRPERAKSKRRKG